jgi:hypothetical protein
MIGIRPVWQKAALGNEVYRNDIGYGQIEGQFLGWGEQGEAQQEQDTGAKNRVSALQVLGFPSLADEFPSTPERRTPHAPPRGNPLRHRKKRHKAAPVGVCLGLRFLHCLKKLAGFSGALCSGQRYANGILGKNYSLCLTLLAQDKH